MIVNNVLMRTTPIRDTNVVDVIPILVKAKNPNGKNVAKTEVASVTRPRATPNLIKIYNALITAATAVTIITLVKEGWVTLIVGLVPTSRTCLNETISVCSFSSGLIIEYK